MLKDNCSFISSDDKALIPVGEPGHAITTGVRVHNASLGPSDHSGAPNWKAAGVVSVNLFTKIPESATSSFFVGISNVTLKDSVFKKSTPIRHAVELYDQICKRVEEEVELFKEILLQVTGSGGEHNVSHASVQVALICLFLFLNLDMLVAVCTCPTQSLANISERVISILNLALQHCATE